METLDTLLRGLRIGAPRSTAAAPRPPGSPEGDRPSAAPLSSQAPASPANDETPAPPQSVPVPRPTAVETTAAPAATTSRANRVGLLERELRNFILNEPTRPPSPLRPKEVDPRAEPVFEPTAPRSLEEAGLTESDVGSLVLKFLLPRSVETGYQIANQIGLRFPIIDQILRQLKQDKLLTYKNSLTAGDYLYELTDEGRVRGEKLSRQTTYCGTAPVSLAHYAASVTAQTLSGRKPPLTAIREAMGDLNLKDSLLSGIGQAIHSGRGMFLFGPPGNGKTSIAERITKSFGDTIWIPRAVHANGEIIRLFDPNRHRLAPSLSTEERKEIDGRWVQIQRPTIIAGGELRMENLEITYIRSTGIGEAPLQMKSNCGTLLIDDFGRQRMPVDELLNRWIVPLEQRHDYLQLESGRSIQVPFDQLIVFSSNLEPKDLVDDAFLRRIPYKIEVRDPSEEEFRALFLRQCRELGFEVSQADVDYLIQSHYRPKNWPFRYCHPRDILRQIENRCTLHGLPRAVTKDAIDAAVQNYFSIML
ncbi:AAA family ATPase [Planctomyces sp. SH-PL14]|uniref:AAA family ATPase n=1 Tax=Planctomyces sp. SH-PL14 TaxID=1632864 RepID=UPI00078D45FF|nr:AAA family ATPase [Planctomyces sp. SH-PL14]AMV21062.1 hypothetical protein VT03_24375 [Planctomyces sp. SH-PL14]